MKTTVFLFHPNLKSSKINKKILAATEDSNIEVRDIYKLYPDFKIDVAREQKAMEEADRIVFQFPVYWYSSPALLKEWQDRVLTYGWAYGSTGKALHGKELILAVSAGGDKEEYQHEGSVKYRLTEILRPFQAMSHLVGLKYIKPFEVTSTETLTDEQREDFAKQYLAYITSDSLVQLGDHE